MAFRLPRRKTEVTVLILTSPRLRIRTLTYNFSPLPPKEKEQARQVTEGTMTGRNGFQSSTGSNLATFSSMISRISLFHGEWNPKHPPCPERTTTTGPLASFPNQSAASCSLYTSPRTSWPHPAPGALLPGHPSLHL